MAIKRSGVEPSVALVRERCPSATMNPETGESFTDKYILEVFKERCHDDGSTRRWRQVGGTAMGGAYRVVKSGPAIWYNESALRQIMGPIFHTPAAPH